MKNNKELNIVERLLKEEKIIINNESFDMKEYRKLEKKFKPNENKLKDVIVFWDDLIQYTTLGLIDCILDDKKEIVDKIYDYDLFFYRKTEDSYYIDFIKNLFKNNFKIDLTDDYIKSIELKNCVKILKTSPASSFFHSFIRSEFIYKSVLFCFRHYFNGIEDFVRSIKNRFTEKNNIELRCVTLDNYKDETEFLLKHGKNYNLFIMQNLGKGFEYLEKSEHNGVSFISPWQHNGVSKDFFTATSALYGNCRFGPYNSELVLFDEGIAIC